MKIFTLIKFAFLNLIEKNVKRAVGFASIIISVALFCFLISLGYGLDDMITNQVASGNSRNIVDVYSGKEDSIKIDSDAIKKISTVSGFDKVCEIINVPGKFIYKGTTSDTSVFSVCPDYFSLNSIKLPPDVRLSEVNANESQPIIINSYVATMFGTKNTKDMLGEEIYLDLILNSNNSKDLADKGIAEQRVPAGKFRVVAVLDQGDTPYVYTPHSIVSKGGIVYNTSIEVSVKGDADLKPIRAFIEAMGFRTENSGDSLSEIKNFFGFFRLFLFVLGLIVFIISAISLANLMEMLVNEKKKEFAWFKILGMKEGEIRLIVMLESVLAAFISAIIGMLIGFGLAKLTDWLVYYFATKYSYTYASVFAIPIQFIIIFIIITFLTGLVLGLLPAKRVSLIKASDGIKFDL